MSTLNLESLDVDSFETESGSEISIGGDDGRCTGCDSGCGIVWP